MHWLYTAASVCRINAFYKKLWPKEIYVRYFGHFLCKHRKEKKSLENDFDQTVDEEDVTMKNTYAKNEECDEIVIVDVEIVNVDVDMISENDTVQEDDIYTIENRTSDDEEEARDDNIDLVKKVQKEPPIPDIIAGSFVFNICDFAAISSHEPVGRKASIIHNWCRKCFSTFYSRDNLKNHLSTMHKKK